MTPGSSNPFAESAGQALLGGQFDEARRLAGMGLSLYPDDQELLEIAALGAEGCGHHAQAVTYWQRLLALHPERVDAANQLGLILEQQDQSAEAEALFRQALSLAPQDASLHGNLGLTLESQGQLEAALACQQKAIALAPHSASLHTNLANLLVRLDQHQEAEQTYRHALQLDPQHAPALANLAVLYSDQHREEEAEPLLRQALALEPHSITYQANLGQLLLAQGKWTEGWPLHESRLELRLLRSGRASPYILPSQSSCPRWRGEPLAGKTILVMPEQGLGDEINFCRYLAWLKKQGPEQLIHVCRPEQLQLFHHLQGPDICLSLDDYVRNPPQADYWTVLLSLPLMAGTTLESIPSSTPYLEPEPERVRELAPLLGNPGDTSLKVGLVWRGNPSHSNDGDRSLHDPEQQLAKLASLQGVRFFSLQKGADEGRSLPLPRWKDLAPYIQDFTDTAALLSQLDLLISVDTSTAHLAGAMGIPNWLLISHYKTDWRWLQNRSDTPWYSHTRLYRQPRRGDWETPLRQLVQDLAERIQQHQKSS